MSCHFLLIVVYWWLSCVYLRRLYLFLHLLCRAVTSMSSVIAWCQGNEPYLNRPDNLVYSPVPTHVIINHIAAKNKIQLNKHRHSNTKVILVFYRTIGEHLANYMKGNSERPLIKISFACEELLEFFSVSFRSYFILSKGNRINFWRNNFPYFLLLQFTVITWQIRRKCLLDHS